MPTKPQRFRRWWKTTCAVAVFWSVLSVTVCSLWIVSHFRCIGRAIAGGFPTRSTRTAWDVRMGGNCGEFSLSFRHEPLSAGYLPARKNGVYITTWSISQAMSLHPPKRGWFAEPGFSAWRAGVSGGLRLWVFCFPGWFPTAILTLLAAWSWRRWQKRRREIDHTCPACGYDLRASRDTCPECGRAIVAPATNEPHPSRGL